MRPRAYSYLRFSSLAQADGDSIRRQSTAAREWCEAHGVELVEDLRDLGVSAFRGKNFECGALGAFVKLAEEGRVPAGSILVVESLDRITRTEISKAVALFLRIIESGIEIVTLADGQRYAKTAVDANPSLIFIAVASLLRSNEESAVKSRRSKSNWQGKLARADERPLTSVAPFWLKLDGNRWRVIESRAAVARRIFEEIASGRPMAEVVRGLNGEKVPTPKGGKAWSTSTLRRMLDSRAALGEFQPGERVNGRRVEVGAAIPDYYPAIIEPALWAKAHRARSSHAGFRGRARENANPFRGLIFATNGDPLHVKSSLHGGVTYRYLRSYLDFQRPRAERTVGSWRFDEFRALFIASVVEPLQAAPAEADTSAAERLRLQVEELREKEGNLAKAIAEGVALDSVAELARTLASQRAELEERLICAEAEQGPREGVEGINWADDAELAEGVRRAVKRVTVDCKARSFVVELHSGAVVRVDAGGDEVRIETDELLGFPLAAEVSEGRASRRA